MWELSTKIVNRPLVGAPELPICNFCANFCPGSNGTTPGPQSPQTNNSIIKNVFSRWGHAGRMLSEVIGQVILVARQSSILGCRSPVVGHRSPVVGRLSRRSSGVVGLRSLVVGCRSSGAERWSSVGGRRAPPSPDVRRGWRFYR